MTGPELDRLIAEGWVSRPLRRGLPEPLELSGGPQALSRALCARISQVQISGQ